LLPVRYFFEANKCAEQDGLVVANEMGNICIIQPKTDEQDADIKSSLSLSHPKAIFDVQVCNQDKHLLTASGDEACILWDFQVGKPLAAFLRHRSSVRSASSCPENEHLFATGSRDGSICVWDTRVNPEHSCEHLTVHKPVQLISDAHVSPTAGKQRGIMASTTGANSVTKVHLLSSQRMLSSGASDGLVKMWDVRMTGSTAKATTPVEKTDVTRNNRGVSSFTLDSTGTKLYACRTDNSIHMYHANFLGQPLEMYKAPGFVTSNNFYINTSLSGDDEWLAAGSAKNGVYMWNVRDANRAIHLPGPEKDVNVVHWNPRNPTQVRY